MKKSYIHGPKVDEIIRRSDYATGVPRSDYYYHADGLGSVSQITDFNGIKLVDYSYDVFGEIRKQTGAESGNTYLFCGRLWDGELKFYYNRSRYYAPAYGRFITKDTHKYDGYDVVGLHRYLYANANPVNYVDPTGHAAIVDDALIAAFTLYANRVVTAPDFQQDMTMLQMDVASGDWGGAALDVIGTAIPNISAGEVKGAAEGVKKGITVLGKYPNYINRAKELGARKFNVPPKFWDMMSEAQKKIANIKFLDRTIKRGDNIILSKPVKNIKDACGSLRDELEYLIKKGFKLSKDGTKMIKK